MKLIKLLIFLFLLTFTTHSFAKSNEIWDKSKGKGVIWLESS